MSSRVIFEPKQVGETKTYQFDISAYLAVGETILSAIVTAQVYAGSDTSPSNLISGSASSSGGVVSQKILGGTLGVLYDLLCTVITSAGQTILQSAYLAVIPPV